MSNFDKVQFSLDELPNDFDIAQVTIKNKNTIEYIEQQMFDGRFDNLLFNYYGEKYYINYGVSRNLFIYLILCFNDINDLINYSMSNVTVKLPNIYVLLNNIVFVNQDNHVNGVFTDLKINENTKNNNTSTILNELKLRLSKVSYNKSTGIIKF